MHRHRVGAAALVLAVAGAALGACAPAPSPGPESAAPSPVPATPGGSPAGGATFAPTLSRVDGWRADLAALVPGMAAIHPNLTHGVTRAELDAAVSALAATVETSTDDQLMVGLLRIVAMVSRTGCDAHTGAYIWATDTRFPAFEVDSLPLRLWLFAGEDGDQVVIVDALPPYEQLIGARIDAIEGHPIADVIAAIDPIVPRDNAQTVRLLLPRFVLTPQILRGLGLADEGPVSLALSPADGAASTIVVEPIGILDYNAWAGPYGLRLPADPAVPWLSRIDDLLWFTELADAIDPDRHTLYVQSNRMEDAPATLMGDLAAALRDPDVARVILDLRHNVGGELRAVGPLQALFEDPVVDQPERLYLLTGRNTFSAASLLVAGLERATGAVIVGEAMGGCPTTWSDPTNLYLEHAGISVSVASSVAVGVDGSDTRLTIEPDVAAVLGREEWADGVDPALELWNVSAP